MPILRWEGKKWTTAAAEKSRIQDQLREKKKFFKWLPFPSLPFSSFSLRWVIGGWIVATVAEVESKEGRVAPIPPWTQFQNGRTLEKLC